jgi:hypothetical protein
MRNSSSRPLRSSSRRWTPACSGPRRAGLPPVDLPLREDLGTRLAWGHVFALQNLGEAESRAVLRRDADRRGIFLSDEVMDYLLTASRVTWPTWPVLARLDATVWPAAAASPCPWCATCWPKTGERAGHA